MPEDADRSRLVVVRHGATAWSLAGRHTGRTDVPLEPAGELQARELGKRLAGRRFALVLVSPLGRARETCRLAGFGTLARTCEDLAEWDYGADEGRTTEEIDAERPGWSIWRDGPAGGETLEELSRRADRVVEAARAAPGDVLAFAHGHVLRVVAARWLGMSASAGSHFLLEAGALGELGWERATPALGPWDEAATAVA